MDFISYLCNKETLPQSYSNVILIYCGLSCDVSNCKTVDFVFWKDRNTARNLNNICLYLFMDIAVMLLIAIANKAKQQTMHVLHSMRMWKITWGQNRACERGHRDKLARSLILAVSIWRVKAIKFQRNMSPHFLHKHHSRHMFLHNYTTLKNIIYRYVYHNIHALCPRDENRSWQW